jgi:signal transduction histidine kinase
MIPAMGIKLKQHWLGRYGVAVLATALTTGLTVLLQPHLRNGVMALFFGSVMFSGWFGGLGPGLVASALSVLAARYFFFPPIYSLAVHSGDDHAQIVVFTIVTIIISILIQIQKRTEQALLDSRERLRVTVDGALDAVWQQQRRIAHELHDSLGQELTGLGFLAKSLVRSMEGTEGSEAAGRVKDGIERALEQLRGLAKGVMPVEPEAEGLMSALQQLAATVEKMFAVPCRFECPVPVKVARHQVASHLYRIAQEAATNAMKHAKPKSVTVSLLADAKGLILRIEDDGEGLPSREENLLGGSGLRIMKYRAAALGAELTFASRSPSGTIVTCSLPTSAEPPAA